MPNRVTVMASMDGSDVRVTIREFVDDELAGQVQGTLDVPATKALIAALRGRLKKYRPQLEAVLKDAVATHRRVAAAENPEVAARMGLTGSLNVGVLDEDD